MASETQDGELFFEDVPAELCCSICCGVLRDPRDTPCGCTFCQGCIMTWLTKSSTCPTDRQPLRPSLLKPTHRIVSSLLGRMRLRCPHHHKGCTVVLTVETVEQHEAICIFRGGVFRPWPKPAAKPGPGVSSTPTAQMAATPPATIPRRRPRAPPAPSSTTQPPATAVNAPAPSWGTTRVPAGSTTASPLAPRTTTTTTTPTSSSSNNSSTAATPSTPLLSVPRNTGNSPLFDSTLRSPLLGNASSTTTPTTNSPASATTPTAPRPQQQVFGSGIAGASGRPSWGASPVASSPSVLPPAPPSPGSEPLFTFGSTASSTTSTTTSSSRRHGHRQHTTPPLNNRAGQGAQRVATFGAATSPFSSAPFSLFSNSPGMPSWGSLPDPVPGNVGGFGLANNRSQPATTQAPASSPSFAASNNAPSSSTAPAAPVFVFGRANCAPPQATPNMAQQQPQQPQTQQQPQPMQVAASSS